MDEDYFGRKVGSFIVRRKFAAGAVKTIKGVATKNVCFKTLQSVRWSLIIKKGDFPVWFDF